MPRTQGACNKNLKYEVIDADGVKTQYKTMKEMSDDLDIERTTIYRHMKTNNHVYGRHSKQHLQIYKIIDPD